MNEEAANGACGVSDREKRVSLVKRVALTVDFFLFLPVDFLT